MPDVKAPVVEQDAASGGATQPLQETARGGDGASSRASAPLGSLDRYFETRSVGAHQLVSAAPNHVCVVRVAATHPCFEGRAPVRVDWAPAVAAASVTGKRKKGAAVLGPADALGTLVCDDGATYALVTGVRGRVLETADDVSALASTDGRLCLVYARAGDCAKLLTREPSTSGGECATRPARP
jgi:hypothetical protein